MDIRQILALAAEKEEDAAQLYGGMAADAVDPAVRALLEDLTAEERMHREVLLGIDPDDLPALGPDEREGLGIAEFLTVAPLSHESRLQDALAYAIRRELQAGEFYRRMAEDMHQEDLRDLFGRLAAMEDGHKVRLEEMYESLFLAES